MPTLPTTSARADFYRRIGALHLAPLWESLHQLVPKHPAVDYSAALWRYDEIRPLIAEAGTLISAEEAVRRVLVLENPSHPGESRITPTLYAGVQSILPGEVAPAHRHTQSAFRFILEGRGAFTAVDGERTTMEPGDLVLTPPWTWHDHGHEGDEPVVWLDGLDIPLIQYLGTGFAENYPTSQQPLTRPEGTSRARFGHTLLPMDAQVAGVRASPVFSYPYARARESLQVLRAQPLHTAHGVRLKYSNPQDGGDALPTMSAYIQLLPDGFQGTSYRSTDSIVCVGVEGRGRVELDDGHTLTWGPRDIFVIPGWQRYRLIGTRGDAVLFGFSDRGLQQKLGLWREAFE